ncbi:MAG TPA: Wadjet anti-phage system protein JetA family protein [Chthoniobacterales bacterium]
MPNEHAHSLGWKLAPLFNGGFFRPLSRPTAAVYVDCVDRLMTVADESGQIGFADARLIIREVLMEHPDVQLDADEGGQLRDFSQRAGQFFNKLLEARWIESRQPSLDERHILISPHLRRLVRLLRELAEDRPAELKDFAATLRSLCRDLLAEDALDPNRLDPGEMRQTVKDLLERAGRAEEQMHAVESLILGHEAAQQASESAKETLERFLVEFHAGDHMVCYDALQEAGLPPRLNLARTRVQEALYDPFTKQRLAEGLARHLKIDETEAYAEAENWLVRLERHLAGIPVKQRAIDGRMADFSRLSAARYHYQTEMRGRRPEQVKTYLETAAREHARRSFADLANLPGMELLSTETEVFFGADSLALSRKKRPPVDLSIEAPLDGGDAETALEEIRRRNLNVLTPQRAVRLIEQHLPAKGDRVSSENLRLRGEDDFLDLLAVLAFDRGLAGGSGKPLRWRVTAAREDFGTEPERIPRDSEGEWFVERLAIERLS